MRNFLECFQTESLALEVYKERFSSVLVDDYKMDPELEVLMVDSIARVLSLIEIIIRNINILKNVAAKNDVTVFFSPSFQVGPTYGCRMMKGYLPVQGVHIGE